MRGQNLHEMAKDRGYSAARHGRRLANLLPPRETHEAEYLRLQTEEGLSQDQVRDVFEWAQELCTQQPFGTILPMEDALKQAFALWRKGNGR